ncbi:hypothetical protein ES703_106310 [subsurface metagenome]
MITAAECAKLVSTFLYCDRRHSRYVGGHTAIFLDSFEVFGELSRFERLPSPVAGSFRKRRYGADTFMNDRFNAGFVQGHIGLALAKRDVAGDRNRDFAYIDVAFREGCA